jgi:flavodoxin
MNQRKTDSGLKTLVIYWSATGNTEKVAGAIQKALVREGSKLVVKKLVKRRRRSCISMI